MVEGSGRGPLRRFEIDPDRMRMKMGEKMIPDVPLHCFEIAKRRLVACWATEGRRSDGLLVGSALVNDATSMRE